MSLFEARPALCGAVVTARPALCGAVVTVPGADDGDRAAPVLPAGKLEISSRADDALADAAIDLFDHGLVPVLLQPARKAPSLPGWPTICYSTADDVRAAFVGAAEGSGLGVLLGNGLADVDLDSETARRAAPLLLPDTTVQSGRPSATRSHWWYRTDDDFYARFMGPDGRTVVELRANSGHQTAIAPSVHPSGERYQWETTTHVSDSTWVPLPELRAAVAAVAIASILTDVWPGVGSRHEAYLALAGALLRGCHDNRKMIQWAEKIIFAIASLTGDEEASRRVAESVPSTMEKLAANLPVMGWPMLGELLTGHGLVLKAVQKAVDELRAALEIESTSVVFVSDLETDEFWTHRPLLAAIRDFARARRIAPCALLGVVLARAAACVPPFVVLPPTRGSIASLNLFVALCGESGSGKSSTMEAAREFLKASGGTCDYLDTSPGSGEGLLAAYASTKPELALCGRLGDFGGCG